MNALRPITVLLLAAACAEASVPEAPSSADRAVVDPRFVRCPGPSPVVARFNAWVHRNLEGIPDIAGAAAAGTLVRLEGFSVGHDEAPGAPSVVGGGALDLRHGSLYGDAWFVTTAELANTTPSSAAACAASRRWTSTTRRQACSRWPTRSTPTWQTGPRR